MLDRDMPFPTPKELARNINEVLPTEDHMYDIYDKIGRKKVKADIAQEYVDELKKELAADLFPQMFHDLRNS